MLTGPLSLGSAYPGVLAGGLGAAGVFTPAPDLLVPLGAIEGDLYPLRKALSATQVEMYVGEERNRFMEFLRPDGLIGLAADETLSAAGVEFEPLTAAGSVARIGSDYLGASRYEYELIALAAGECALVITADTDKGQRLIHRVPLRVLEV